jgi:predicted GH43/DUF377 family glycosyl hydrolase
MIAAEKHGIILSSTENEFENKGVINPGSYQEGDTLHFLYRAIQKENLSTIGYAKTTDPLKIVERMDQPFVSIEFDFEKQGMEDPKIVKIEDTYYMTYMAYDGINKMGAFATSKDLITFEKKGIISPPINYHNYERLINFCNKDFNPKYHFFYHLFKGIGLINDPLRFLRIRSLVLFPKKINGKFALLISIFPGIQIVYFDDFDDLTTEFWTSYLENLIDQIILDPEGTYEINYIGLGCVPIETNEGWLLVYYGAQETQTGLRYHVKVALLDLTNPKMVLSRSKMPLFSPQNFLQQKDQFCDMVFPMSHGIFNDTLYIYHGIANKSIAVSSVKIDELIQELLQSRKRKEEAKLENDKSKKILIF